MTCEYTPLLTHWLSSTKLNIPGCRSLRSNQHAPPHRAHRTLSTPPNMQWTIAATTNPRQAGTHTPPERPRQTDHIQRWSPHRLMRMPARTIKKTRHSYCTTALDFVQFYLIGLSNCQIDTEHSTMYSTCTSNRTRVLCGRGRKSLCVVAVLAKKNNHDIWRKWACSAFAPTTAIIGCESKLVDASPAPNFRI